MRRLRLTALVFALAGVAALAPASANAATTFGSNLTNVPNDGPNCGLSQCTFAQNALIPANTPRRGLPLRSAAWWSGFAF